MRPDYCPLWNEPCQKGCDPKCGTMNAWEALRKENERLRARVADGFDLIAHLTRQPQRPDRAVGVKAAGSVGQIGDLPGINEVGQHRGLGVRHVDPPHRNGDDLRSRRRNRRSVLFEILVFASPDNQPRAERPSGHGPAVVVLIRFVHAFTSTHEMHDFQHALAAHQRCAVHA